VHLSKAGAVFGWGGVLLGAAFIIGCVAWQWHPSKLWLVAGIAFCGWVAATVWLVIHAPNGRPAADSPVQHRYIGGRDGFRRYAFGNLLPEADQFAMGFRLVPAADRLFTMKQAKTLTGLTASIYAELEADPAFHALGSVMPETYDELWGLPFNHGHYYLYVPPGLDRANPRPALVFLHGSGGNFKAYTWLLSRVADQLGMVLIAPTYGFGNWREPDTSRIVQGALEDAAKVVRLDAQNVHLIGLSNGGLGVSQAGRSLGPKLRSLIFLSPVFNRGAVSAPEFIRQWRDRPVLVISGRVDDRIPIDYVAANVDELKRGGADVTFRAVEGADHLLVFSHRALVLQALREWIESHHAIRAIAPKPEP
jgi:pimeloyl-ACP methyl ester carboxylesterase